jgi:8-amino-7-oxononanoate synthase
VLVGTFGKSLGTQGAFVTGSETLRTYLWNRARSFVFSTGASPAVAAVTTARVVAVRLADDRRDALAGAVSHLRDGLAKLGLPALGVGPIVPVVLGSEARALVFAGALRKKGFEVFAVRPPTVAPGTSRLRLTVAATHTTDAIDALLRAVQETLEEDRCTTD